MNAPGCASVDSVDVLLYDAETGTIDDALSVETVAPVAVAEPFSDSALAMLRAVACPHGASAVARQSISAPRSGFTTDIGVLREWV